MQARQEILICHVSALERWKFSRLGKVRLVGLMCGKYCDIIFDSVALPMASTAQPNNV